MARKRSLTNPLRAATAAFLAAATTLVSAQTIPPDIQKAAEEKAINLCSTCHGPRGISTSSEFPILAAHRATALTAKAWVILPAWPVSMQNTLPSNSRIFRR
jgi:cytochrome c553